MLYRNININRKRRGPDFEKAIEIIFAITFMLGGAIIVQVTRSTEP